MIQSRIVSTKIGFKRYNRTRFERGTQDATRLNHKFSSYLNDRAYSKIQQKKLNLYNLKVYNDTNH